MSLRVNKREREEEQFFPKKRVYKQYEIDVFHLVCNYFSNFKDLLNFEAVGPQYDRYTQKRWKELRIEHRFDFNWPETTEKGHYMQGLVLQTYILGDKTLFSDNPSLQKLYDRLEGFMMAHPQSLGSYLWSDLSDHGTIHSQNITLFQYPKASNSAGSLMCQGLERLRRNKIDSQVDILFIRAITLGATCASYFAIKYLPKESKYLESWVHTSAALGDYRGLESLIQRRPQFSLECYAKGIRYPPVFAGYANFLAEKNNFKAAAPLWEEALKSYKNQAPFHVYWEAGSTYYYMRQHDKADPLFIHCRKMDKVNNFQQFDAEMVLKLALNKYFLGKYERASVFFKCSYRKWKEAKEEIPLCLFFGWSSALFRQKNYVDANKIHKIIEKYQEKYVCSIPKKIATEMTQTTEILNHETVESYLS